MKKLLCIALLAIITFSVGYAHGDHGSSFSNATILQLNQLVAGTLSAGLDTDTFCFTASESGLYLIQSHGDLNTRGHLFNQSGEYINISDDDGSANNFAFYLKMNAGEKVYIKVDQVDWLPGDYQISVTPFELAFDRIETGATSIEKQLINEQDFTITIPLRFYKGAKEIEPPSLPESLIKVILADQTPCTYTLEKNDLKIHINRPVDTHISIAYGLNQQISIPIRTYLVSEPYIMVKNEPSLAKLSISSSETIATCYVKLDVAISPSSGAASGTIKINYDRNRLTLVDDKLMALYKFSKGLMGDNYKLSSTSTSLLRKLNNGTLPTGYEYNLIGLVRKMPDEWGPPGVTQIGELLAGYDTDLNTEDRSTRKTVYFSWAGETPLEEGGNILSLVFLVNDTTYTGSTPISMDVLLLSDFNQEPIEYELSEGEVLIRDYFMGDVEIDGVIDDKDVAAILAHTVYNEYLNSKQRRAADVNDDDLIDANDALMILLYLNGFIDTLEP